jgi:hypothetical protein
VLFLPTAPNITTGFVLEVEPDRYYEIDDSVEDALTRLLSAGFGESSEEAVSEMFGTPHDGGERPAEVSIDDVTGDGIEGAPLAETETGTGGGQESSVESAGGTPPDEDR